jgi:hypothetical protein
MGVLPADITSNPNVASLLNSLSAETTATADIENKCPLALLDMRKR